MSATATPAISAPVTATRHARRPARLQDWLYWQEALHTTAIDLGLDRCRTVAERMRLLKPDFTVISISGTNGKGSSAAMLERFLCRSGLRVGAYTSPHLLRYNERISIDGAHIDDAALCHAFGRVDACRGDISLTYFEFGTLAALDIFHAAAIDIALMEVGLGGRLDAVNILDADIALLTTVDFDHERWLGHDRESIGREKAGIFRPNRPAVCADPSPPASIAGHAAAIGARLYRAGLDFHASVNAAGWRWQGRRRRYDQLPLPGGNRMQAQNAAGVLMVIELLAKQYRLDTDATADVLRDFRLAGRMQIIPGAPPCILDVAHNPQAAAALVDSLRQLDKQMIGANHLVIGMLRDKNHAAVFARLREIAAHWYLVDIDSGRAATAARLEQALPAAIDKANIGRYPDVTRAIMAARACARPGDRVIITGSFVTVGAAIDYLNNKRMMD